MPLEVVLISDAIIGTGVVVVVVVVGLVLVTNVTGTERIFDLVSLTMLDNFHRGFM